MSMISKTIDNLKDLRYRLGCYEKPMMEDWKIIDDAIDIIKTQGEKLSAMNLNGGWIPVDVSMPEERDSIFARFKGTEKWKPTMFEKTSNDVNVTVEFEDGTRKVETMHTNDGKWRLPDKVVKRKIIAWCPLPDPYNQKEE